MQEQDSFPYRIRGYEPGIYVELYLPKRSRYQGRLYETLTRGFDPDEVRRHFTDPAKRPQIMEFLRSYAAEVDLDERVEGIEPFYRGYSMYEVDGVFYSPERKTIEERAQIIRMMFIPDMERMRAYAPELEMSRIRKIVRRYFEEGRDGFERPDELPTPLLKHISDWVDDIGLFLFGYIVFELCVKIDELNADDQGELEEEIWLSSFWDLRLNRVKLTSLRHG